MATKRTVLIVNLILSLFFLMNVLSVWAGLNIYPGGWRFILMGAVAGNLLWLLIPLIFKRHSSPLFRLARAVFAPIWVLWTFLVFLYSVFLLLIGAIYLALFMGKGMPFAQFVHMPSNIFLGALVFICVVGFIQAIFMVHLERVPIHIKNLPPEFKGFKIAMVSDLHVGLFTRLSRLRQFAKTAQKENPDLFVVCGDITDDDSIYLPKFLKSLEALDPHLPALGILGNHDVYANPEKTLRVLQDSRLQMLVNEGMVIKRGNSLLWIAGVGDQGARRIGEWGSVAPDFDKALEGKPAGAPTVLLAHQPQGFSEAAERKVELTLSGHTHGGQVGFRPLKWSLAKLFMKFHMGHFTEGESQLYVTPGTGYWALPVRFGLTPEVTLIELLPE